MTAPTKIVLLLIVAFCRGQSNEDSFRGFSADPELVSIPEDIINCYVDRNLWDRHSRLPSSIESLVALIRKAEMHPSVRNWTPGRLAADLIHRFRFDGIHYDRCIDTSTGAYPLYLDLQNEVPKMQLVWRLIHGDRAELPDDILEPHEKCALHWMISYSVNTTFREEEYFYYANPSFEEGYQNDAPLPPDDHFSVKNKGVIRKNIVYNPGVPMDFNCDSRKATSYFPWEIGVVWTRAGPVAGGSMLAGLAAGLRPQFEYWPTVGTGQSGTRKISSVYGVTLSADLAQTALMKKKGQPYVGPDGFFNTSLCPSEFLLTSSTDIQYGDPTYTLLTIAELNGGIDGLILGLHAEDWERQSELSLSQMIDMYYSRIGLNVLAKSTTLSACQRYDNFRRNIDHTKVADQAFTFATELKRHLISPISDDAVQAAIRLAQAKAQQEIEKLEIALSRSFFECTDDFRLSQASYANDEEIELVHSGIADVALILDTSIFAVDDDLYQQQLSASLALQLDIWSMGYVEDKQLYGSISAVEGGDTLDIAEGLEGKPIFATSTNSQNEVKNKAKLACQILRTPLIPSGGDVDPGVAVTNVLSRMAQRRYDDLKRGTTLGRSQVVILVTFGRIGSDDKQLFKNALYRMKGRMPEAKLIIVTRWAPVNDFLPYVDDPNQDIITLQPLNEERRAILDARRIADRIARIPSHITFEKCGGPDYVEHDSQQLIYLIPRSQRTFIFHPRHFWSLENLKLIFDVRFNSANICWSRRNYDSLDKVGDEECKSVSVTKGSQVSRKAIFDWIDPCNGKPSEICLPIYFRIEAIDSGGLNCYTQAGNYPCRVANAVEITVKHQGMSCNSCMLLPSVYGVIAVFYFATFSIY